jgi:hypothetical protein
LIQRRMKYESILFIFELQHWTINFPIVKPSVAVFCKRSGLVQTWAVHGSGVHGLHGMVLGGPNSKKLNPSHRWPPGAEPLQFGTVRSGPFFFLQIQKIMKFGK